MIGEMKEKGFAFLAKAGIKKKEARVRIVSDMRYSGQGHEITVTVPTGKLGEKSIPEIENNFKEEYQLRYGRSIENIPIESVTWRVLVSGPSPAFIPRQAVKGMHSKALKGTRPVYFDNQYVDTPVYDRYALETNKKINGPCIIEEFESTTVVGENSVVLLDEFRNMIIDMKA
jgi:N-methylhydantoinase A